MSKSILKIRVYEVICVYDDPKPETVPAPVLTPFFRTEFVFTMADDMWAPVQARAPSVLIDFELIEASF